MKFPAFDPIDLTNNSGHFSISDLKVENIVADPNQPRKKFNEASIGELSASIKLHGIIQPIIVRQIGSQKYQIIAGERRWRAACLAGVNVVPAIIQKDTIQVDDLVISLIENIQREELNPIELAESFYKLNHEYNISHESIALIVGKSRTTITNLLRLLNLDKYVQEKLINAELEMGHARPLLALSCEQQVILTNEIIEKKLTARGAENLVKLYKKPREEHMEPCFNEVDLWVKKLSNTLSSKVTANVNRKGEGRITIHFSCLEKLNNFIETCVVAF